MNDNALLLEVLEEVKCLRQEVARLSQQPQQPHYNREWFPTGEAWYRIGVVSEKTLRRLVADGTLRQGTDYRDDRSPESNKAIFLFHVENCKSRLAVPPEKRTPLKFRKAS